MLELAFDAQTNLVSPLVSGIFQGSTYGLLGLGLVLIYKSNRIFNFAQGEFATVGALTAFLFVSGSEVFGIGLPDTPYFVAILLGITMSVLVALATERVVVRPLFDQPRVVLVVGTVGVALLLIAVEGFAYPQTGQLPTISEALGVDPVLMRISGVSIRYEDVAKLLVLAVLAVLAFLFFRYTNTGTAILAVSQDATAARVVGISVERISMVTWGLAGLLGGVAGVLLAIPPTGVAPGIFTGTALATAFAAAVLGGMTSLPGAFIGGLAMGLVEAFANADIGLIPGLDPVQAKGELTVALFLLIVLLVRPRGLLGKAA
jgi:branched-chain amino acid transport system permease protein